VCAAALLALCLPWLQEERKCLTFYLPKLIIVGFMWLSAVTLGIWQTVNELQDPTYQYKVDIVNFQGMKVFFLIVVALYILYLIFLVVRACSELKNMPYSGITAHLSGFDSIAISMITLMCCVFNHQISGSGF